MNWLFRQFSIPFFYAFRFHAVYHTKQRRQRQPQNLVFRRKMWKEYLNTRFPNVLCAGYAGVKLKKNIFMYHKNNRAVVAQGHKVVRSPVEEIYIFFYFMLFLNFYFHFDLYFHFYALVSSGALSSVTKYAMPPEFPIKFPLRDTA